MSYEPTPGSVPANVVGYLRNHPGERLTLEKITELFHLGSKTSNLHTLMAKALDAEVVRRARNEDGEYEYFAGPSLGVAAPLQMMHAGSVASKKRPRNYTDIDPSKLAIGDDPLPESRARPGFKYGSVFERMKPGQCIKCEPNQAPVLATALKKWVVDGKLPYIVRATSRYTDGAGRVWMLEDPKAVAPKLKRAA